MTITQANLTTFLAVWGAILSTLSIIWNIRRDAKDKGRLKVLCYFGHILDAGEAPGGQKAKLIYSVTNIGKKPLVVCNVGGSQKGNRNHFLLRYPHQPFPRTLQPGEYFLEWFDDLSVLDDVESLWSTDSLNKRWKSPRKELNKLFRSRRETEPMGSK